MKHVTQFSKPLIVAALLFIFFSASARKFIEHNAKIPEENIRQPAKDTSLPGAKPDNKNLSAINDEQMKLLDKKMAELDEKLKGLDMKIESQIKDAMAKVDIEKVLQEAEASIKNIDLSAIEERTQDAVRKAQVEMKKIDFSKLESDLQKAQQELTSEKFKEQFNAEKLQNEIDAAMQNARESIEKAKENLSDTNEFISVLEKDGLINKKKVFTIEWKENGDLFINGTKQSQTIADKYRKYFKKGGYTIKNKDDEE